MELLLALIPTAGGLLLAYSYVPQIKQLLNTKSSEDLSVDFWKILTLAILLMIISPIYTLITAPSIMGAVNVGSQLVNLMLAGWVWYLVVKYK